MGAIKTMLTDMEEDLLQEINSLTSLINDSIDRGECVEERHAMYVQLKDAEREFKALPFKSE